MRDKLNTLSLSALREIAKVNKIKNVTVMRKNDLIETILAILGETEVVQVEEKLNVEAPVNAPVNAEAAINIEAPVDSVSPVIIEAPRNTAPPVKTEAPRNIEAPRNTASPVNTEAPVKTEAPRNTASQVNTEAPSNTASSVKTEVPVAAQVPIKAEVQQSQRAQEIHTIEKPKVDSYENSNIDSQIKHSVNIETNQKQEVKYDKDLLAEGILEVLTEGYGFIRCENFLPGENDVYVSPAQIRKFYLKTGDVICGAKKSKSSTEKFSALYNVHTINGKRPDEIAKRPAFEKLTPIFPNERIHLEPNSNNSVAMRIVDLISPIGKGQRGMIVSQPKAGKTTLLKQIARAVTKNNPEMHLIILLIDERPEEVTDIKESIEGKNVEVIYSTFDELPDRHKRVSEMVIERAKRLVEQKEDVMILLDSITRLTRAYNLTVQASGRTLSGGLDPAALYMPKRFFGAARKMREGGSLTILATALVDTGSKMDDIVFEEFKGTGNMELVLDRKLSEKRVFPAIDIAKSGTRREDLLLTREELEGIDIMRKALNGMKSDEAVDKILNMFSKTRNNAEFLQLVNKTRII